MGLNLLVLDWNTLNHQIVNYLYQLWLLEAVIFSWESLELITYNYRIAWKLLLLDRNTLNSKPEGKQMFIIKLKQLLKNM